MNNDNISFINFVKKNIYLVIVIISIIIVCFGYALTISHDITIDEELSVLRTSETSQQVWIQFSRYGISFLTAIFMPIFDSIPFFNMLLSLIFLGLNALLLCYFISRYLKNIHIPKTAYSFLAICMVAYPANMDCLNFNNINFAICISFVCATIGLYFISNWVFKKRNIISALVGIVLLAFTFSVYQSFVGVYFTLMVIFSLLYMYKESLTNDRVKLNAVITIIIKYLIAFGISMGLYYLGDYIVKIANGVKSNDYASSLMSMNSIRQVAFNFFYNFKTFVFQGYMSGEKTIKYILGVFLLSQILLVSKKGMKNKFLIMLLSIALILAPFTLGVIYPGMMVRSLGAIPMMVGMSGFFIILVSDIYLKHDKQAKIRKIVFSVITTAIILISYSFAYIINLNYYGNHIRYVRDVNFGNMLAADIIKNIDDVSPDKPIIILGEHEVLPSENIGSSVTTASMFSFDIIPIRSISLLQYLGYDFISPSFAKVEDSKQYAYELPVWPADGSIKEMEDYIIVKISENIDKPMY